MKKERENLKTREAETKRREKENEKGKEVSVSEEKKERKQVNLYARMSEIKRALFLNQPMIVLLYKEACLSTNELNSSLPSVVVSLLQDFGDVFPEEIPDGLPPIRGIEHQIDFTPKA